MRPEQERELVRQQLYDIQLVITNISSTLSRIDERQAFFFDKIKEHAGEIELAASQISELNDKAKQVKYWLAGAAATVAAFFGVATWFAANLPPSMLQQITR